ncbi:triacylglycerol lipase [Streptomyces sp. TBY4]|uniref:esterase/lipase family protein n=1 Tax=Streptomyces sp. TBY4 TaxID=2962030 RepID=UPI0020B8E613|nr:hypothetical protein [Streptomyces sp. TBY4]MCP3756393.1 hypothetical protein [Streptomyces sp. TBY4]
MARAPVKDLVVVLPGIMGSRLADADGRPVWDVSGGALWAAVRTLGGSLKRLSLPKDLGDGHPGDGVAATGVLPSLHAIPGIWHPVDGYTALLDWLERAFTLSPPTPGTPGNLVAFPYDWRLSCRYNAGLLKDRTERELTRWRASAPDRQDARVVFVCHSMGGLVARYYTECLGGHEITRRVITLGTPHRGSVAALAHLANGLRKGWGPFGLDLSAFARSLPSLHQLVPDYACVKGPGGTLAYVRDLPGLPGVDPALLADAGAFHEGLRRAADRPVPTTLDAVAGVLQRTATTAEYTGGRLVPLWDIRDEDEGGDGTVPRLSARPANASRSGYGVGESHTSCEQHGSLQNNTGVREVLWRLLGQEPVFHRGPGGDGPVPLGVLAPPLLEPGEPYEVTVAVPPETPRHDEQLITADLCPDEGGPASSRSLRNLGDGRYTAAFPAPDPGGYRLAVWTAGHPEAPVTALTLVCGNGG